jgi:hypothetical protein
MRRRWLRGDDCRFVNRFKKIIPKVVPRSGCRLWWTRGISAASIFQAWPVRQDVMDAARRG